MDIFGGSSDTTPAQPSAPTASQKSTVDDILGLFGSTSSTPTPAPAPTPPAASPFASSPSAAPPPQPAAPKLQSYIAYDKNELHVTLTPQTSPQRPGVVNVLARFQVKGANMATGLNFQVAVPRVSLLSYLTCAERRLNFIPLMQTQQLQMLPMSQPDIKPGTTETQQMRITAPPGVCTHFLRINWSPRLNMICRTQSAVRLRIRISYTLAGRAVQDQVDFSGFPPSLTGGGS